MNPEIERTRISEAERPHFAYLLPNILYTALSEDLVKPPFSNGKGKVADHNRVFSLLWESRKSLRSYPEIQEPLYDETNGKRAVDAATPVVFDLFRTLNLVSPFITTQAEEMMSNNKVSVNYDPEGTTSWFMGSPPRLIFGGVQLASQTTGFNERFERNGTLVTPKQVEKMALISTLAHEFAHFIDYLLEKYGQATHARIPDRHRLFFSDGILYYLITHKERLARGVDELVLRKYMEEIAISSEDIEKFFANDNIRSRSYAREIESVLMKNNAKGYSIADLDTIQMSISHATRFMHNTKISDVIGNQLLSKMYWYRCEPYNEAELRKILAWKSA